MLPHLMLFFLVQFKVSHNKGHIHRLWNNIVGLIMAKGNRPYTCYNKSMNVSVWDARSPNNILHLFMYLAILWGS